MSQRSKQRSMQGSKSERKLHIADTVSGKLARVDSFRSGISNSNTGSIQAQVSGTGYKQDYHATRDGRYYSTDSQGRKQYIAKADYDAAITATKKTTQDAGKNRYAYDEGNGKYCYVDGQGNKHRISQEEFNQLTSNAQKYKYSAVNSTAQHYYASNDGRYFYMDNEGNKFFVDKTIYDQAIAQKSSNPGKVSNGNRIYHKEGARYYYVNQSGQKIFVNKAEFERAAKNGTKHALANNGERNYYAAKDGSYFYIDQTGSKVFVSREEYDQHQQVSLKKKQVDPSVTRYQEYLNSKSAKNTSKVAKMNNEFLKSFHNASNGIGNTSPAPPVASSNQFKTSYGKGFSQKRSLSPPIQVVQQGQLLHSNGPMDLVTTKQSDFKPYVKDSPIEDSKADAVQKANNGDALSIVNSPKAQSVAGPTAIPAKKLIARTSNQVNYPDWGHIPSETIPNIKPPLRTDMVSFDPRTSYNQSYIPGNGGPTEQLAKKANTNPIQGADQVPIQSTAQSVYKQPAYNIEHVHGMRDDPFMALEGHAGHFNSMHREEFVQHSLDPGEKMVPQMDPHKSTALYVSDRNHKGQFLSKYGNDFKNKDTVAVEKATEKPQLQASKMPMDLKTTKQQDFVPHEPESKNYNKEPVAPIPRQQVKFNGRSMYNAEYPDWEHYQAIPSKPDNLPYRGADIPFGHESTYNYSYFKKDINPTEQLKQDNSRNPVKHADEVEPMTSSNRADFQKRQFGFEIVEHQGVNQQVNSINFSGPHTFTTEHRNNYQGAPAYHAEKGRVTNSRESDYAYEVASSHDDNETSGGYVYELRGSSREFNGFKFGDKVGESQERLPNQSPLARDQARTMDNPNTDARNIIRNTPSIDAHRMTSPVLKPVHTGDDRPDTQSRSRQQLQRIQSEDRSSLRSVGTKSRIQTARDLVEGYFQSHSVQHLLPLKRKDQLQKDAKATTRSQVITENQLQEFRDLASSWKSRNSSQRKADSVIQQSSKRSLLSRNAPSKQSKLGSRRGSTPGQFSSEYQATYSRAGSTNR